MSGVLGLAPLSLLRAAKAHLLHVLAAIVVNLERLSQHSADEKHTPRPPTVSQDYFDAHDIQRLRSWRAVS